MPIKAPPATYAPSPRPTPKVVPGTANEYPAGGSPEIDFLFDTWVSRFAREANDRFVNEGTGHGRTLPRGELTNSYEVTSHLFKWLVGVRFNDAIKVATGELEGERGINFRDRRRLVAIQFSLRRDAMVAEAKAFAGRLAKDAGVFGLWPF